MYNHNKAQQGKNRVHISWDILYGASDRGITTFYELDGKHEWQNRSSDKYVAKTSHI